MVKRGQFRFRTLYNSYGDIWDADNGYEFDTEVEGGWYQDDRGDWHQDPTYAQYYEEYYKQFYEYQEYHQQQQELQRIQSLGENDVSAQPTRKNSTNSLTKVSSTEYRPRKPNWEF